MREPKINIIGQKFGRLLVISNAPSEKGYTMFNCKCDCGNKLTTRSYSLRSGATKSCGCLNKEKHTKHGMGFTRTYHSWTNMRNRCANPTNNRYYKYGGRGIKVCERWLNSFENFLKDMGECPPGHSIDRINNDGDYTPENCRWATLEVQQNNSSRNVKLTYNGETLTVSQWAKKINIKPATLWARIKNHKWSIEKALNTPIGG